MLERIIKKHNLREKSKTELEKLIGDSDRNCLTIQEYNFLKGEGYTEKVNNLQKYLRRK